MTTNRTLSALAIEAFAKNTNNIDALRVIAFYYMSKFPQYAEAALIAIDSFPAHAFASASAAVEEPQVVINVPATFGENGYHWQAARYVLPKRQVAEWQRVYRSGARVEAIKACRNQASIGLKEAKDLCEYIGLNLATIQ